MDWRSAETGLIKAIVLDGACMVQSRAGRGALLRLRQSHRIMILNRVDLCQPAAPYLPAAALFLMCQVLGVDPGECLVVEHDHRRAHIAHLIGFHTVVTLQPGGHTRKLMAAGLLARQDLRSMGLLTVSGLSELNLMLQRAKKAA